MDEFLLPMPPILKCIETLLLGSHVLIHHQLYEVHSDPLVIQIIGFQVLKYLRFASIGPVPTVVNGSFVFEPFEL